jgi:acetyl esterase/lipase
MVRLSCLAGGDPEDPLASPLYADFSGVPPMYIQVGGDETLLGESRQLDENARKAGVDVRLDVFPEQQHTFQMAAGRAPEADDAIRRLAEWVRPNWACDRGQAPSGPPDGGSGSWAMIVAPARQAG